MTPSGKKSLRGPGLFLPALLILAAAFPASGQQMVEVAERQAGAGLTEDARTIIEGALATLAPASRDRALFLQAALTALGDSAAPRLERCEAASGSASLKNKTRERLGDLAYTAGRYDDALAWWRKALVAVENPAESQRLSVKVARAEIRSSRFGGAVSALNEARAPAGTAPGLVSFYSGLALEKSGKTNEAARAFTSAYTQAGSPYAVAALYYLDRLYGAGGSRNAADWRDRWAASSRGTIFESAASKPEAVTSAGWTIQLGAFSSSDRARSLAARLSRLGLSPKVLPPGRDGLYRVRIEGIGTKEELNKIVAVLKKNRIDYNLTAPGG
ncbi:MAG: SPOR domain-containing protein [Candidatus Glassbacteria bacterium]